jgi:hypothetical protein
MCHVVCRNPGGEIRVDLTVPGAQATIIYDNSSIPSRSQIGANPEVLVIPATVTISSLGSLSGPPTAIHIHGSASRSAAAGVLVTLCQGNCPSTILTNPFEFFVSNFPLEIVAGRSTYINVHTSAFPGGEIRGQISPEVPYAPPPSGSSFSATSDADMFQEGGTRTLSYTANAQQAIPQGSSRASAAFAVTFHNNNGSMTFSSITTSDLSDLIAVHIHGPCPNRIACNAPVLYTICGGGTSCPSGANPSIPGFNVDTAQITSDGSLLIGLTAQVLRGEKLFYVNFHTAA